MRQKICAKLDPAKAAIAAYCLLIILYYGMTDLLRVGFNISSAPFSLLVYALLSYKIVMARYEKREWAVGILLLLMSFISLYHLRDTTIFTNVLVLLSLKNIDIERMLKPLFWCALACYVAVILCSLAGIGLPMSMTLDFRGAGEETRYCFGYAHPNSLHLFSVRLMCLYAGAYFRKINWKHICGLAVFNCLVFYFTDSRTGVICGYILVLLLLIYRYFSRLVETKLWKIGVLAGIAAIIVFGILSVTLYGRVGILDIVNRLFTGRIKLAHFAYTEMGISWWGNAAAGSYIIDNGIMGMLLQYGLVPFIVYWLGTFLVLWYALKNGKHCVTILMLVFGVYALMEGSVLLKIFRNIPMIYMGEKIFSVEAENKE